jgi:hypothetical protein
MSHPFSIKHNALWPSHKPEPVSGIADFPRPLGCRAAKNIAPPAKLQEGHPLIGADQPTISPSLKIIAEPIEIAQSRRLVTKERVTKNRHVARKSRRHERDDAYARYYDPRRNSYYGGYGSSYWR